MKKKLYRSQINVVLWAIIFLGLFLRIYKLRFQSLWLDEIITYDICAAGNLTQFWEKLSHHPYPPLFYLLNYLYLKLIAPTEFMIRLPSVIFGTLTIPVCFYIGKNFISEKIGLLAAFIFATSSSAIYYAQTATFYSFAIFLSSCSTYFWLKTLFGDQKKDVIAYTLLSILLIYTYYLSLVPLSAQALAWLYLHYKKENSLKLKRFLAIFGVMLLSFIPLSSSFFHELKYRGVIDAVTKPHIIDLVRFYYRFFKSKILTVLSILAVGYYFYRLFWKRKSTKVQEANLYATLALAIFIPILILFVKSLISTPLFQFRYITAQYSPLFIFVSIAIISLASSHKRLSKIILLIVLVAPVFPLIKYYQIPNGMDYRSTCEKIIEKSDKSQTTYIYGYFFDPMVMEYYLKKNHANYKLFQIDKGETFEGLMARVKTNHGHKFWFIVHHGAPKSEQVIKKLKEHKPLESYSFHSFDLFKVDPQ